MKEVFLRPEDFPKIASELYFLSPMIIILLTYTIFSNKFNFKIEYIMAFLYKIVTLKYNDYFYFYKVHFFMKTLVNLTIKSIISMKLSTLMPMNKPS